MSITLDLILQCRPVQDMVHLLMRITLQWDINEMSYFYSASTNGFYSTEFHGTNIPDDAVEISESEWKTLINSQSVTTNVIAPLQDAVDLDMATDDETKLLLAWKKYRVLLMRVNVVKPEWPMHPNK